MHLILILPNTRSSEEWYKWVSSFWVIGMNRTFNSVVWNFPQANWKKKKKKANSRRSLRSSLPWWKTVCIAYVPSWACESVEDTSAYVWRLYIPWEIIDVERVGFNLHIQHTCIKHRCTLKGKGGYYWENLCTMCSDVAVIYSRFCRMVTYILYLYF